MFFKQTAFVALLAASVYAQDSSSPLPTSTGTISPCVLNCASSTPGCSFTDASCVCVDTDYQSAVAACLTANCTPAEQQEAAALQASLCGDTSSDVSSSTSSLPSSVLSSVLSSVSSKVSSQISSKVSSVSSRLSTATNPPTSTSTGTGSGGGAAGLTVSLLATGGAVLLAVVGGGLFVF